MADTVTAHLGMTKPEVGASNNTWGAKINGNLDILDERVVRQTIQWTITMGDDDPVSALGSWILTRYGNDGLSIDNPIEVNRQTGLITAKSLTVLGVTTINGAVSLPGGISGNLGIAGGLGVTGNFALDGSANIGVNLAVGGSISGATLHITGAVTFDGTLAVAGAVSGASLAIAGNASVGGDLDVTGKFTKAITSPYMAVPPNPPAGSASVYFDVNGNPVVKRPDGSIAHLGVPPGTIAYTGAATADVGWALLNGQAVSRTANPVVFARFGILYGPGDGIATFNLPDVRGRVIAHVDGAADKLTAAGFGGNPILGAVGGDEMEILTVAQMPAHNHVTTEVAHSHATFARNRDITGGASVVAQVVNATDNADGSTSAVKTNLTINNNGGGLGHPNVQPTIILNAQVKLG
jgi:microcystin-dependent protein